MVCIYTCDLRSIDWSDVSYSLTLIEWSCVSYSLTFIEWSRVSYSLTFIKWSCVSYSLTFIETLVLSMKFLLSLSSKSSILNFFGFFSTMLAHVKDSSIVVRMTNNYMHACKNAARSESLKPHLSD